MNSTMIAPESETTDIVIDTYHGVEVADPFRWLEEHQSARTRAWIDEQAAKSRAYLDALPHREVLRNRVMELLDHESISALYVSNHEGMGQQIFYVKRNPTEQQGKLYKRDSISGKEVLLLEPASLGSDNSLSITILELSPNGKLLAYGVRTGGQGARYVGILNVETGEILPDGLPKGAVRGFGFLPENNGFIYMLEQVGKLSDPKTVKIHFFGQPSDRDKTVFYGGKASNMRLVSGFDQKSCTAIHTVIQAANGQNLHSVHLQRPCMCGNPMMTLVEDTPISWDVRIASEWLYVFLDQQDGKGRKLLRTLLEAPDIDQAEVVLVEGTERIQSWHIFGERILMTSVENLSTVLHLYSLTGRILGNIELPSPGTANILGGNAAGCFFSFESYVRPREIYYYDFARETRTLFSSPIEELNHITVRRVEYPAADGTLIPLTLLSKNETFERGHAPVLLTAYGAAGVSLTPQYSPLATCFVELGGIFAIAHIRGGGEYGQAWEEAGKRRNRPTVHKDFISAAEYLIASGTADANRIGIAGGSNSGLLVGTAMTQRPDLFRAVLCVAPFMDMLRYHRFDNTQFYVPQFGSADDPKDFPVLLSYSPYHNVKDGTFYPALLMVSGDADTRCDPMHARKFVARLQAATKDLSDEQNKGRPILLDWNPLRGHFATLSLAVRSEAIVDRLLFLAKNLGMEVA
jgi:prolyl oligopeptidase